MGEERAGVSHAARVLERIDAEVRPRLDMARYEKDAQGRGGYDCCGCSTYEQIVNDIVALLRDEFDLPDGSPAPESPR